jgi:hypothetical protein
MKRFQRIFYQVAMVLLLCAGSAFAQGPAIFFTDLESGPKIGGQNNKGVFVTIYGTHFGATQGASTVTVGGGSVDNCPVWGAPWLWYQKTVCQLGSNVSTGNIVATVNGQASNPLPFTVRSGNIYFVATTGNDSNDGSFAHPFLTISAGKNATSAGDTVYVRGGLYVGFDDGYGRALYLGNHAGTAGNPIVLSGYPGETAVFDMNCCQEGIGTWTDLHPSRYWTIANMLLEHTGTETIGIGNTQLAFRLIGNISRNTYKSAFALQGAGTFQIQGNDIYNMSYSCLFPNICSKGYAIYMGGYGVQDGIDVGWNKIHNELPGNSRSKGVQFYGHINGDRIRNIKVHDNILANLCMNAIVMGGTDAPDGHGIFFGSSETQYVYNNLFIHNGSCDPDYGYSALQVGDTNLKVGIYNNTFYYNGNSPATSTSGDIDGNGTSESVVVSNNIFFAPAPNIHYCGYICDDATNFSGTNNLFYNFGNGPGYLTGNINGQDPKFVNPTTNLSAADFHLQPVSPARNAGKTVGLVTRDIAGTERPQETVYDIGAYEYGTAIPASTGNKPHAANFRPGEIGDAYPITSRTSGRRRRMAVGSW